MSINLTDQDIFISLKALLVSFLPAGTEIVQAQDNRVSMPKGPFVSMNNISFNRLSTNVDSYVAGSSNPGIKNVLAAGKYDMQLDFYGPDSGSWAAQTQALFRDEYATDMMPAAIQPLYADNPMQLPLINGEEQYEQRWKLVASMQFNPIVQTPQDFANQLAIGLVDVDVKFPP